MRIQACSFLLAIVATAATETLKKSKSDIETGRILVWLPMCTKSHYITFKVPQDYHRKHHKVRGTPRGQKVMRSKFEKYQTRIIKCQISDNIGYF